MSKFLNFFKRILIFCGMNIFDWIIPNGTYDLNAYRVGHP
jgi:hypothetical protein